MKAINDIKSCINSKESFVVEAGAGSGKTYALIQTLKYLIDDKGTILEKNKQNIICITYTNVAKNEIIKRIEYNELVSVLTIHEFLWQSIKQFQKQIKIELCNLNNARLKADKYAGKESDYIESLENRIHNIDQVFYNDSSFRNFEKGELHHDDVIELSKMIFENYTLITTIVAQKFPYIFIDEYQDTSRDTILLLIDYLLSRNKKNIVLGFYGDSHQKIYDNGIGSLEEYYFSENKTLKLIKKEENYRSSIEIVNLLNSFRTNIQQKSKRDTVGSVKFIYWKSHPIKPKKQIREFNNNLKTIKNKYYDSVFNKLENLNWNFGEDSEDKILVLANRRIAERAKFSKLYDIYSRRYGQSIKERLLDRNHFLIRMFTGYIDRKTSQERKIGVENLLSFWDANNENEIIRFIKKNGTSLLSFEHSKKKEISTILSNLSANRNDLSIKEVLDIVLNNGIIFSKRYEDFIEYINQSTEDMVPELKEKIERDKSFYNSFINLPYKEIFNFWKHVKNETVFSTKHGTKGDEYRNVLTVIDDTEWIQQYNFNSFFNNSETNPERKLRTRNLFYVECSRAKDNLVVLMLSQIEDDALNNIKKWFGKENVIDIEDYISL